MAAPPDPARTGMLALAVATLALIVAAYSVARPASNAALVPASSTSADRNTFGSADDALRGEIAQLRGDIVELRQRIAALSEERGQSGAGNAAGVGANAAPPALAPSTYVSYEVPNKALTVMSGANGAVMLINTDPALTGKTVTVSAKRADGKVVKIDVKVPPP